MENRPVDVELSQMLYDVFESGIDGHLYRGYTIVPAKGLPPTDAKKRETFFNSGETRKVWWVFAGMGSQWVGMGKLFVYFLLLCDKIIIISSPNTTIESLLKIGFFFGNKILVSRREFEYLCTKLSFSFANL